ncbi:MAG: EamA family transporter [Acidimicrobiia bacterium]|nr:EamA family transporter [Acidimicrobiia bacterium]
MSTTGSAPDAASTTGTGVRGVAARYPLALVVAGTVLYSTGPVFVASASVSGPVFSFWRLWAGVLAFGLATVVHVRVTGRRPTREGWSWAAKAGVAFGVHQLLFMTAIRHSTVVDVTLLGTLAPVPSGRRCGPALRRAPGADVPAVDGRGHRRRRARGRGRHIGSVG